MRGAISGAVFALAMAAGSPDAFAQGWLADRRLTEGPGIKTGDLELHPGIGGEVGYDSNWFLRSDKTGANLINGAPLAPPADAAVFRLTPSFYVQTLGTLRQTDSGMQREPGVVSFRGGLSATGMAFIGKEMTRQHNVGVSANARLDINQNRPVGFGVYAGYHRLVQPNTVPDPDLAFNRDDINVGGEVVAMPGGGTLDLRAGYQLMAALFEETQGVPYSSLTHEVYFKDRWKFRPRTALFSDTTLRFVNYPDSGRAANFLNDSTPLRTRFGLTGLISERFGALLAAGYGATFFQNPNAVSSQQYDSVNAQAEGTFYLGKGNQGVDSPGAATLLLSTISLGFVRDFQMSLLANYYNSNKVYSNLEYWFGGKVVLRINAYGEQLNYPDLFFTGVGGGPPAPAIGAGGGPVTEFTNYRLGGGLFAEYRFTESFGLNTTFDVIHQFSDTLIPNGTIPNTNTPAFYSMDYTRFQAFLGARYFY